MNIRNILKSRSAERGAVLFTALMVIAILSLVFAPVLGRVLSTSRQVAHIASWQESLVAAEAGSESAMAELRRTLYDPTMAFSGWTTTKEDGTPLPNQGKFYALPRLSHPGEGNTELDMTVLIDAPPEILDGSDRQWYRIRSTGTTYLPGGAVVTPDKRDHQLRKFNFIWDRKTGQKVTRPQSTRLVELLVKPASFDNAITSDLEMHLNNFKIVIDSYDSRYEDMSTNGLYDPAKAAKNGDIATNSKLIDAGDAHVWGDAYTNAGKILNGSNISGEQRDDFYQELLPIAKPTWTTYEATPNNIIKTTTLAGGTKANPKRYKVNQIMLASQNLIVAPSAPGVESYTEVWLAGNMKVSGNGSVIIEKNANLKIFIDGNIDIKGNGTFNANSQPARFQLLGVKPPGNGVGTVDFGGNGIFVGAIYAPNHDVKFGATGSAGTYWGSLTGRSIVMGGTTYIHYDEALADTGHVIDFRVKNWFEDSR